MINKTFIQALLAALVAFTVPIILLLAATSSVLFDANGYKAGFTRHRVYEDFGGTEFPDATAEALVNYFMSPSKGPPAIGGFGADETSHLHDVKLLVIRGRLLLSLLIIIDITALIVLFIITFDRALVAHLLSRIAIAGGGLTLAPLFILSLAMLAFSRSFAVFHVTLFPQGNYMFPSYSTLIRLFPEAFFSGMALAILLRTALAALMLLGIGVLLGFISLRSAAQKAHRIVRNSQRSS